MRLTLDTIRRDEELLIEKAISGDKEAFGHLYDHLDSSVIIIAGSNKKQHFLWEQQVFR